VVNETIVYNISKNVSGFNDLLVQVDKGYHVPLPEFIVLAFYVITFGTMTGAGYDVVKTFSAATFLTALFATLFFATGTLNGALYTALVVLAFVSILALYTREKEVSL